MGTKLLSRNPFAFPQYHPDPQYYSIYFYEEIIYFHEQTSYFYKQTINFHKQTGARPYERPKDLSVVIGNISKNKTVSTFSGKLPGCPNLFCDEDSGILVTVCRSRGYDRWTKAPMEPLNVAVHLEFLRQAIAGLPKPAPQCNWRLMEGSNNLFNYNFGQTQGTGYGQGSIQRTGYVSLGNSANHQEQPKRTESWHLISCDEAEVNYPNKELTPRDISDTKDRIERGLVKPVWDFTYYQVDKCGQYYCDSVNDVLVSVCGNKSWFGWSQSYVTNLLDVGIDALAERPDRKANCSWAHRWPSLSPGTDYRINYLIDRMLDIPISDYWRSVMPPSLKVNKVDLGKTCKDFNSTIKQKPMIPPPPKPVDIQFPDPNPASGMVMTKGTQYVGYVIKTDQNNGGMLLKHLKGTDDYLKKNRISSPDIITNTSRPVDIVELTEADCHAFVCDDHPDRNILLSLCGNWYPIADIPVSEDPRYRNATLAWLAMRSMLTAYMCAADEGDGKKFLGGDRSVYCSNTDSDIKDPMLTSNTTRGLYPHGDDSTVIIHVAGGLFSSSLLKQTIRLVRAECHSSMAAPLFIKAPLSANVTIPTIRRRVTSVKVHEFSGRLDYEAKDFFDPAGGHSQQMTWTSPGLRLFEIGALSISISSTDRNIRISTCVTWRYTTPARLLDQNDSTVRKRST
ncbi:hypothetical protein Dda_2212 [Drechslerella dactyloides]|uniref:Uncharacterized protein n=1 Tax=Drechslerella dactyloides TaxID=74499 RepID=A0AAD6J4X0_DREDA|nr:hypothetical protein Dda_2212 [Drechslerella dactyloides]